MMTELDGHILIASEMLKTVNWMPCGELGFIFEYYHVFGDLYLIHDKNLDCYHFMKGNCPKDAMNNVLDKHSNAYEFVVNDDEAEGDEE